MSTAALPRARIRPSGWWGMALFVATEATLFGTIFGTYFYLRLNAIRWPPPGVAAPDPLWPLLLVAALVSTSPLLWTARRAALQGRAGRARAGVSLALVIQSGYLAVQLLLFAHDLDRFRPEGSAYGSIYFTMLGAHDAHVAAGILLELWLLLRLLGGLTRYRLVAFQVTTFYWHFVNVLAVLVVTVQLAGAR
jgi:heme/copper-type cytochrome/quinol oxidase subunit 3